MKPIRKIRFSNSLPRVLATGVVALSALLPALAGSGATNVTVRLDVSETPDLEAWGNTAKTLCDVWYLKIAALLPSEDFEPPETVRLRFSKNMRGVAATGGTRITVAANYLRKATNDFGMVIHKLTHVVQAYPSAKEGCTKLGWLVEGIADYIRLVHFEPQARRPRINSDKASYRMLTRRRRCSSSGPRRNTTRIW